MRTSHEVVVDRIEFRDAILTVLRGRHQSGADLVIAPLPNGVAARSADAEVRIKAVGVWQSPVAADAVMVKLLAPKLPKTKELTVGFFGNRLRLGPTTIDARRVG